MNNNVDKYSFGYFIALFEEYQFMLKPLTIIMILLGLWLLLGFCQHYSIAFPLQLMESFNFLLIIVTLGFFILSACGAFLFLPGICVDVFFIEC